MDHLVAEDVIVDHAAALVLGFCEDVAAAVPAVAVAWEGKVSVFSSAMRGGVS